MPKEFLARLENCLILFSAKCFCVAFSKSKFKFSAEIFSKSAGDENIFRISLLVLPKTSEKTDSYSGKIWSKTQMVLRFKSPIESTSEILKRERLRISKISSEASEVSEYSP